MRIFYVRPSKPGGYGKGDGSTYDDAWSGLKEVDWPAVRASEPATVWVCGNDQRPSDFTTVHVESSYLSEEALNLRPEPVAA